MLSNFSLRARILYSLVFLFALVLIFKLYLVQVVNGQNYQERAERQYYNPGTRLFNRGTIYLTAKDGTLVPAAVTKAGFLIALNPQKITDAEDAYKKINEISPLDKEIFMARALKKNDSYEEILHRLDSDAAMKIKDLKIPGVMVFEDKWRFYPGDKTASNVLGFVSPNKDDDNYKGRYGLEKFYENVLKREGDSDFSNFFADAFSNINKSLSGDSLEGDVVTTIEPTVQTYLETAVQKINEKWSSKESGAIIMNPQNGEIYAMASYPTFDPNKYGEEKDMSVYSNPLVESVFEMGSIIKPLTMAAGIDSGTVTANTTYDDKGFLVLNGLKIQNYDGKGRGVVDMQTVLSKSLNTGAAFVAMKMGNKNFSDYMINYGLGEKTGVDLPNEVSGKVSNLKNNIDIDHATAAYGHGIAMSPVETVRALSSLANGGVLVNPHVTEKIVYDVGFSKTPDLPQEKRVLKKETSEEITRMLVKVVDEVMLDGKAKNPNYSVAAKTGTAELTKPGGGYYDNRFLHTFFGYFPAYNPRFIVFLFTLDPQGVTYASETLTSTFLDISKFLINYYEVPPDR